MIIKGIKTFNDIWYKNCYYSSFFPIINFWAGTVIPFLTNEKFEYVIQREKFIDYVSKEFKKEDELIGELGLHVIKSKKEKNIASKIKEAILREHPVLLIIDCYFESTKRDTYRKIHSPHAITIYGYDEANAKFYILDHDSINSVMYKEIQISYEDIVNGYESFLNRYTIYSEYSFFEYYKERCVDIESINEKYIKAYVNYYRNHKEDILGNCSVIKMFKSNIMNNIEKKQDFSFLEEQLEYLNNIVNNKKAENYVISKIKYSEKINDKYSECISLWSSIRAIIAKIVYTKNLKENAIDALKNKLNILYESDVEYYSEVIALFGEN